MALQRYREEYDPEGDFIKYDDLTKILDLISKAHPDASPRAAVIDAVFEMTREEF